MLAGWSVEILVFSNDCASHADVVLKHVLKMMEEMDNNNKIVNVQIKHYLILLIYVHYLDNKAFATICSYGHEHLFFLFIQEYAHKFLKHTFDSSCIIDMCIKRTVLLKYLKI